MMIDVCRFHLSAEIKICCETTWHFKQQTHVNLHAFCFSPLSFASFSSTASPTEAQLVNPGCDSLLKHFIASEGQDASNKHLI